MARPRTDRLGRDEPGKPQAARFPAGHHGLVAKAAKAMDLTVCKAESAGCGGAGQEAADWAVVLDRPWLRASQSGEACTARLSSN